MLRRDVRARRAPRPGAPVTARRGRAIPDGAITVPVPDVRQRTGYTCGPAALLAVCAHYGVGPGDEARIAADMRIRRAGSDPAHLVAAARRYGLSTREHRGMTDAGLRRCLRRRRPVIVMLQAWAEPPPRRYRDHWRSGHWVVAIGFDDAGVYLEDPVLAGVRGFLGWRALDDRWHDVEGPRRIHVPRYGLEAWRAGGRPRRPRAVPLG
jgi:predicted double-glycine peptidase